MRSRTGRRSDATSFVAAKRSFAYLVAEYVCFKLNNQEFGINVNDVLEVLPIPEITPVVHTPTFIKGVINLRGEIVVIIDLKIFFNLETSEISHKAKIVVAHSESKIAGFLVDEISQIQNCEEVNKDSIPVTITGKISEFLSGVAKIGEYPLMIINLKSLLNSDELKQFE